MSKTDLIVHVAEAGGLSNADAKKMVELVLGEIENGLARHRSEGKYAISGFGVFSMSERAARKGRNPRTGEEILIPASTVLKFKPAPTLKSAAGC